MMLEMIGFPVVYHPVNVRFNGIISARHLQMGYTFAASLSVPMR